MELYIAGGCSEHGRNSFLVTGKKCSFLVDAGLMKEKPDEPWPKLSEREIRKISYLFLTHCHADHAGALRWLYECGFQGRVIASRETFLSLDEPVKGALCLEDFAKPLREFRLDDDLWVEWGRSGHCIGSVWYMFRIKDRKILFSGDYEERSFAYKCDKIRNQRADLAVIDCAYGFEKDGADAHRKNIEQKIDSLKASRIPALFPVPSHGRGFDVIRLLAERGMPVVVSEALVEEFRSLSDRRMWLKRGFLDAVKEFDFTEISEFEKDIEDPGRDGEFPEKYAEAGILVRDSQLFKDINRSTAERVCAAGGRVILTGKQDPSSFARALLDTGKADFFRISVHQNAEEMLRLVKRNSFGTVIPYHCRSELSFRKKKMLVLKPGDCVRF